MGLCTTAVRIAGVTETRQVDGDAYHETVAVLGATTSVQPTAAGAGLRSGIADRNEKRHGQGQCGQTKAV